MSAIERFIEQAWADHVDDLPGVRARLDEGLALLQESPGRLDDYLQLAAHIHLEHGGDARAMRALLERTQPLLASQDAARATADKARLTMALLQGAAPGPSSLPLPARVRAHRHAVVGLAARGELGAARRLLQSTGALARDADAAERTEAAKALAAAANNLARLLLDGARSAEADALMLDAAALSRTTWAHAGTWLNVERAEYLLAVCHAAAGQGARAVDHAKLCAALCEANGADAFERFFAQEALVRALRAQGEQAAARHEQDRLPALLADIGDEGNRAYARSVLDKLGAASSRPL